MKEKRSIRIKVTPQTLYNLSRLAKMAGDGDNLGRVVDKLVRDRMIAMKGGCRDERREGTQGD